MELHTSLIYEILSRLPAVSVFSCLSVCKTFSKLHANPCFAQAHLTNAPQDDRSLILQDRVNSSNLFFINVIDLERLNDLGDVRGSSPWKTLDLPTHLSKPNVVMTHLVGSCNGLVCLNNILEQESISYMYCVGNPILGEFMILPQLLSAALFSAFGHCIKSNKYKVLRFTSPSSCEIHTLGTSNWSNICNVPYPRAFNCIDSSSLDGNIPWLTESSDISETICSFNCETEQCIYLSPPAHFFTIDTCERMSFMQVGLLGGLFCISYLLDKAIFEVCVMLHYGVESSWTKKISLDTGLEYKLLTMGTNHNMYIRVDDPSLFTIRLLNNGDMLLRYVHDSGLICYSPRKQATIGVIPQYFPAVTTTSRPNEEIEVIEFVPSFISLKNIIEKSGYGEVVPCEKLHRLWPHRNI